jgi:phosphate transport system substrate-binding protein
VDGVIGSQQTLLDGTYPIHRPLFMFTNGWPSGKTLEFINFVLDANMGQVFIEEAEYVPLYH